MTWRSTFSDCPARFDWSSFEFSLGSPFAGYRDDPRAAGEPVLIECLRIRAGDTGATQTSCATHVRSRDRLANNFSGCVHQSGGGVAGTLSRMATLVVCIYSNGTAGMSQQCATRFLGGLKG